MATKPEKPIPSGCKQKNCPHYYERKIHGFTDYMCTARRGRKVRPMDLGSGRLIQIKNLRECPLENPQKNFPYEKEFVSDFELVK